MDRLIKKVQFMGETMSVREVEYGNCRIAIIVVCADGEPYCTASINMVDEVLSKNEVVIKTYSGGRPTYDMLIMEEIIENTGRLIQVGYTTSPVCRLIA